MEQYKSRMNLGAIFLYEGKTTGFNKTCEVKVQANERTEWD